MKSAFELDDSLEEVAMTLSDIVVRHQVQFQAGDK